MADASAGLLNASGGLSRPAPGTLGRSMRYPVLETSTTRSRKLHKIWR
jgi:hypothetical protein